MMDDLPYFLAAVVLIGLMFAGLEAWARWGRDRWRAGIDAWARWGRDRWRAVVRRGRKG